MLDIAWFLAREGFCWGSRVSGKLHVLWMKSYRHSTPGLLYRCCLYSCLILRLKLSSWLGWLWCGILTATGLDHESQLLGRWIFPFSSVSVLWGCYLGRSFFTECFRSFLNLWIESWASKVYFSLQYFICAITLGAFQRWNIYLLHIHTHAFQLLRMPYLKLFAHVNLYSQTIFQQHL